MKFKISNPFAKMSALVVGSFIAGQAHAQDLAGVSSTLSGNVFAVGDIVSNAAYVAGTAFTVGGLIHMKGVAENPGQKTVMGGAGKLAVGGALLVAPAISNYAINSIQSGAEAQGTGVSAGYTNRFNLQ